MESSKQQQSQKQEAPARSQPVPIGSGRPCYARE